MFGNIVRNSKEKILLASLDRALKSVNLYKDENQIIAGYKVVLKYAIEHLAISLNFIKKDIDVLTDKKIKKESSKLALNRKIFDSLVKMESIISKDEDLKGTSERFKALYREYRDILEKK